MKDWTVVTSESGYCREGFPIGKILVRKKEDIQKVIEDYNIANPIITKHEDEIGDVK